eukprot:g26434.t1
MLLICRNEQKFSHKKQLEKAWVSTPFGSTTITAFFVSYHLIHITSLLLTFSMIDAGHLQSLLFVSGTTLLSIGAYNKFQEWYIPTRDAMRAAKASGEWVSPFDQPRDRNEVS